MHYGHLNFLDSLFMVTSAMSATGLVVKNVGTDLSFSGQLLLLILVQIGGFGYMFMTSLVYLFFKGSFIKNKILNSNLNLESKDNVSLILKNMFFIVLSIELLGSLILFFCFYQHMDFKHALWAGLFHGISAFNNAGFSVFETGLLPYVGNYGVSLTISFLIILGGLGYFVLLELFYFPQRKKLSHHAKIVVITTLIVIFVSWFSFLIFEYHNAGTIKEMSFPHKLLASFFTIINYRTAGFNTLDLSQLKDASLSFGSLFMVIGGSPAGTAGGIKTTTLAILILYAFWSVKGEDKTIVFKREIDQKTINQAFCVIVITFFVLMFSLMFLSFFEDGGKRGFLALFFEICSAFGTTGVSVGDGGTLSLSALFGEEGKILIILLMFIGKVGTLTFLVSFFTQQKQNRISYAQTKILI